MFNTAATGNIVERQESRKENSEDHLHDKGRSQMSCERGGVCVREGAQPHVHHGPGRAGAAAVAHTGTAPTDAFKVIKYK